MGDEFASLVVGLALDATKFDSQITATVKRIKASEEEMKAAAAEAQALGKGMDAASARAQHFKAAVEAQGVMVQAWKKKLDEARASLERNKQAQTEAAAKVKAAEAEHKKLIAVYGRESEEAKESQQTLQRLKQEHAEAAQKVLASENAVSRVTTSYAQARTKLLAYHEELKKSNAEHGKLAMQLGVIGDRVQKVGASIGGAGGHITNFGKKLSAISGAAAAFGTGAVVSFTSFDDAMRQVAATMDTTTGETERLTAAAQNIAQEMKLPYTAKQSAEALNYLAAAGYDCDKSIAALPYTLQIAAAGGTDLAYASDLVTGSMTALGLSAEDLPTFIDQIATAAQKSNAGVAQLGEGILNVGGTAKSLAGGTRELTTILGILADNGIKGAEGGTALRNVILGLGAPTDSVAKYMRKLGVEAYDAQGNLRPLPDTFGQLNAVMSSMTEQKRTEVLSTIFNRVDLKSANALLGTTASRYNELSTAIEQSHGSAERMARTMEGGIGGRLRSLQSAAEGLGIAFGKRLDPMIEDVTKDIASATRWFASLNGGTQDLILKATLAAAAAGPLAVGLGKVTAGIGTVVSVGGKLMTLAAAHPVLGIVTALGAITAAALAASGALDSGKKAINQFASDPDFTPFEEDIANAQALISDLPLEIAKANAEAKQQMSSATGSYMTDMVALYTDGKRDGKKQISQLETELSSIVSSATSTVETNTKASYDSMYAYYQSAGTLETEEAQSVLNKITEGGKEKQARIKEIEGNILTIQRQASKEKRDLTAEEIAKIREYLGQIEEINGEMLATYDKQQAIIKAQVEAQTRSGGIDYGYAASAQKSALGAYTGAQSLAKTKYDEEAGTLGDLHRSGTLDEAKYKAEMDAAKARYDAALAAAAAAFAETEATIVNGLADNYPEMAEQLTRYIELMEKKKALETEQSDWYDSQKNLQEERDSLATELDTVGDKGLDFDDFVAERDRLIETINAIDAQLAKLAERSPETMKSEADAATAEADQILSTLDRDYTDRVGSLLAEGANATGTIDADVAATLEGIAAIASALQAQNNDLTNGESMVLSTKQGIDEGKIAVVESAAAMGTEAASAANAYPEAYTSGANTGEGYAVGMESKTERVRKAGAALAQAGLEGHDAKAEIASPSKAARRSGQFEGDGYVLGMQDRLAAVRRMGAKLAEAATHDQANRRQYERIRAAANAPAPEPAYSADNASVYNNQRSVVQNLTINADRSLSPAEVQRQAYNALRRAAMGL